MKAVDINPKKLRGTVKIPPSKSISHRAIIAAALSEGESRIENVVMSKDMQATCSGMRSYGAQIDEIEGGEGRRTLMIKGVKRPVHSKDAIDCIESGSTLRFLIPIAALSDGPMRFEGRGKLVERPLDIYYDIFEEQGISYKNDSGKLPLTVDGKLKAGQFHIRGDVSSQFITGLMFTLPLLHGDSSIVMDTPLESKGYIDLTIEVLNKFGIDIQNDNYERFIIRGDQSYRACNYRVEGDFSQAAFWLVAGCISSDIDCMDLNMESLQGDREIVDIIEKMGIQIQSSEANTIKALSGDTKAMVIDASQIPDLVPIISVLASLSRGTTVIKNAARLRIKESDRIKSTASELSKLGANIKELEEGLVIDGVESLEGGTVRSWNDHRIAMAMAVASTRCSSPVTIVGSESVAKSYPGFWEDFKSLGGDINERDLG
ncbi:3-phosphoshikimate 1-carboxyvinyltransferase [Peptoclostridium litorale DSM 5388]|uniref:3-phosphoshikimate 1-carboxyvinyltransferase n=1 Tax=Peptoclostridium litorale DSM 5388 TaxID=1121324 RepID=A0A069RBN9_PEPLI|nr:3-phosphoshikimate 1-carboxyvinyltransferase [Peptoclostridium litorale]KDR94494.1 3-phosphoshikimate 1-carboxyvinyltransferase AroA [Peptoclostridium litorale DSM 5388]SIO35772.1 3-phosphoshikimate 1-carboxyvinyltransferase [Peptoclostridium litorale DSM 5388]